MALIPRTTMSDTAAGWAANNAFVPEGWEALETDTGKTKIGDGKTQYNSLPYSFPTSNVRPISAAYSIVAADAGGQLLHPSADTTARTWTIPANSAVPFPVGTHITFINQASGGVITISITTDTMRLSPGGTTGDRALAANGIAIARKITATEWIISGSGLT